MRYHALAADYDGTLAHHGRIDAPTWAALRRLRESGRKLIMATGRQLDELLDLLEDPKLFNRIVAENGAVVHVPETRETRDLAPPPSEPFVAELRQRMGITGEMPRRPDGAAMLAVGRVIIATWEPYQRTALELIHELGLDLQVILNKGAVMILPSRVNKATGVSAALPELGLAPHNVVGVGDAENDHAFLALCGCGVAVANALPALKESATLVTRGDHGAGVTEVIDHLIADDLAATHPQ